MKPTIRFSQLFDALLLLFFLSGASGLIYEVAWFRLLSLTFGVSVYAASAVLTAYMGGLALGSLAFGRIAARSRAPLRLFALLQAGVGLYALLTPLLFAQLTSVYVWAFRLLQPGDGAFVALRVALAMLVLLPPTFLMGGTLPALSRLLAEREREHGRSLGTLYAVNTLGGVIGTLAAGIFLIQLVGTSATLALAGAIDLAVAAAAYWLSRRSVESGERRAQSAKRRTFSALRFPLKCSNAFRYECPSSPAGCWPGTRSPPVACPPRPSSRSARATTSSTVSP